MAELLTDDPIALKKSINDLLDTRKPFAIGTCRSGLAIEIYSGDGETIGGDGNDGKRVAYTTFNNDSLVEAIAEAIKAI